MKSSEDFPLIERPPVKEDASLNDNFKAYIEK